MSSAPPTPTTDEVLAGLAAIRTEIQRAVDAMVADIDMPGAWTERQKGQYRSTRAILYQHLSHCGVVMATIQKAVADLKWMLPARDRLRPVQVEIERQILDLPDANRIADFHAQKREWDRQLGITSSLKQITGRMGVNFFGATPALAEPLKTLLSDVCPHGDCPHGGRPYVFWVGALPVIEEKIAEAEKDIAGNLGALARFRAEAAPLLVQARAATITS